MTAEEVSFDLPRAGLTLRGWRTGNSTETPVLCLHGWLENCVSFEPLLEELPEMHLIAVDLPGHGLSDRLPTTVCQALDFAACVLELIREQGWERVRIIGHSIGGLIAVLTAGLSPDVVERLVLVDALVQASEDSAKLRESVARYLNALFDDQPGPRYKTRSQAIRTRAKSADSLLDTAERLSERDLVQTEDGYTWRTDERLRYPFVEALTLSQLQEFVRAVTAPMLVFTAVEARTPPKFDPAWALAPVRQVFLPGGHHPHIENVEPVARDIRAFFAEAAPESKGLGHLA